jgi:hypothetical protein
MRFMEFQSLLERLREAGGVSVGSPLMVAKPCMPRGEFWMRPPVVAATHVGRAHAAAVGGGGRECQSLV